MPYAYVATLGERPTAITFALDILLKRHPSIEVCVLLHTDPQESSIDVAYQQVSAVIRSDYPQLKFVPHEITRQNGEPMLDVTDKGSTDDYYQTVARLLHHYKQQGYDLHLMVAGGRKSMSILATLAAGLVCDPVTDRVWTILSPQDMAANATQFHIPAGRQHEVKLLELMLPPLQRAPGQPPEETLSMVKAQRRRKFWDEMSAEERSVAELLMQSPDASNQELGNLLNKSARTIENQLSACYVKMQSYVDDMDDLKAGRKRQRLVDFLRD